MAIQEQISRQREDFARARSQIQQAQQSIPITTQQQLRQGSVSPLMAKLQRRQQLEKKQEIEKEKQKIQEQEQQFEQEIALKAPQYAKPEVRAQIERQARGEVQKNIKSLEQQLSKAFGEEKNAIRAKIKVYKEALKLKTGQLVQAVETGAIEKSASKFAKQLRYKQQPSGEIEIGGLGYSVAPELQEQFIKSQSKINLQTPRDYLTSVVEAGKFKESEIKRYETAGYKPEQARVLAEYSQSVQTTPTPEISQRILYEKGLAPYKTVNVLGTKTEIPSVIQLEKGFGRAFEEAGKGFGVGVQSLGVKEPYAKAIGKVIGTGGELASWFTPVGLVRAPFYVSSVAERGIRGYKVSPVEYVFAGLMVLGGGASLVSKAVRGGKGLEKTAEVISKPKIKEITVKVPYEIYGIKYPKQISKAKDVLKTKKLQTKLDIKYFGRQIPLATKQVLFRNPLNILTTLKAKTLIPRLNVRRISELPKSYVSIYGRKALQPLYDLPKPSIKPVKDVLKTQRLKVKLKGKELEELYYPSYQIGRYKVGQAKIKEKTLIYKGTYEPFVKLPKPSIKPVKDVLKTKKLQTKLDIKYFGRQIPLATKQVLFEKPFPVPSVKPIKDVLKTQRLKVKLKGKDLEELYYPSYQIGRYNILKTKKQIELGTKQVLFEKPFPVPSVKPIKDVLKTQKLQFKLDLKSLGLETKTRIKPIEDVLKTKKLQTKLDIRYAKGKIKPYLLTAKSIGYKTSPIKYLGLGTKLKKIPKPTKPLYTTPEKVEPFILKDKNLEAYFELVSRKKYGINWGKLPEIDKKWITSQTRIRLKDLYEGQVPKIREDLAMRAEAKTLVTELRPEALRLTALKRFKQEQLLKVTKPTKEGSKRLEQIRTQIDLPKIKEIKIWKPVETKVREGTITKETKTGLVVLQKVKQKAEKTKLERKIPTEWRGVYDIQIPAMTYKEQKQDVKTMEMRIPRLAVQMQKQELKIAQANKIIEKSLSIEKQKFKSMQQIPQLKFKFGRVEAQIRAREQARRYDIKTIEKTEMRKQQKQKQQKIPFKLPLPGSEKALQKASTNYAKAYRLLIKRAGKYKPVGLFTRGEALMRGEKIARETLAATFKLEPTQKRIRGKDISYDVSDIFRRYKIKKGKKIPLLYEFIQKRGTRLSTRGEVSEILGFKRRKRK